MSFAAALMSVVQIYTGMGAVVAALFLTIGIDRIDADARGAYAFRPLLIPAVLLIWPLVLWRWWREETGRATPVGRYTPPRRSHGVAAVLMGVAVAVTLLVSFGIRQTWPADAMPRQIAPPAEASR